MSWYRMHRGWMEDDLWQYDKYSTREAWCWLIENAKFDDTEEFINGELVKIKRGSLVQTERQLAKKWKWGRQKVRTFLKNLQKVSKIDVNLTQHLTQISIIKYDTYQKTQPNEQPSDNPAVTQQQPSYKEGKESKELKNSSWMFFLRCCLMANMNYEKNARATQQSERYVNKWLEYGIDEQDILKILKIEYDKKKDDLPDTQTLKYYNYAIMDKIKESCQEDDQSEWIERMSLFEKGKWLDSWGPKPNEEGTRVPKRVLINLTQERDDLMRFNKGE